MNSEILEFLYRQKFNLQNELNVHNQKLSGIHQPPCKNCGYDNYKQLSELKVNTKNALKATEELISLTLSALSSK